MEILDEEKKLVIFDFDETVLPGVECCAIDAFIKTSKIEKEELWFEHGNNGDAVYSFCCKSYSKTFSREQRREYDKWQKQLESELELSAEIISVLKSLQRDDIDVVILSSRKTKSLNALIENLKIGSYFKGVYGRESFGGVKKPDVKVFYEILFNLYKLKKKSDPKVKSEVPEELDPLMLELDLILQFDSQKEVSKYSEIYFIGDQVFDDMECAYNIAKTYLKDNGTRIYPVLMMGRNLKGVEEIYLKRWYKEMGFKVNHIKSHVELEVYLKRLGIIAEVPSPSPECSHGIEEW
jgi:phosphoglycolate phosphatase-like HAD superfamily hydrolase